mmetsp:Transcript_44994/g.81161  ORF Transcript_44994/g.81161 Transcript_44994/m.81161 type:complete len:104 (-) Transcript_44994:178-489(-)
MLAGGRIRSAAGLLQYAGALFGRKPGGIVIGFGVELRVDGVVGRQWIPRPAQCQEPSLISDGVLFPFSRSLFLLSSSGVEARGMFKDSQQGSGLPLGDAAVTP